MRDRFSELIAQGVAAFHEKPVAPGAYTPDPLVKTYNGCWGLLTDTHMSKVEDGWIITGTFTQSPYWERFACSSFWGSTNIKLATGYCSFDDMLWKNNLCAQQDIYNSDHVIKITPRQEGEEGTAPCDIPCCPVCPACCYTAESNIPRKLNEFLNEDQLKDFAFAWKSAQGNAMKIIEGLKESRYINSEIFRISADNKYLVAEGNQTIKFPLD